MKVVLYLFLILGSVLFSCSNDSQSEDESDDNAKYEQLFNSTSDSLKKYEEAEIFNDFGQADSILDDFIDLNYKSFKKKYSMTSVEMYQISQAMSTTLAIAKASIAIEKNTQASKLLKIEMDSARFRTLGDPSATSYKFVKNKHLDSTYQLYDESVALEIMMSAYDAEYDTIKEVSSSYTEAFSGGRSLWRRTRRRRKVFKLKRNV